MDSEKNVLAGPDGVSHPQINTQAYLQGDKQDNQQPVILLGQQGHTQIPSNISAEPVPTSPKTVYEEFEGSRSVTLGGLQLTIGIFAIGMESAGFKMQPRMESISFDIYFGTSAFNLFSSLWCGAFFFTAGGLAIGSGKKKTRRLLLATTVMQGCSLFAALVFSGMSGWAAADSYESCVYVEVPSDQVWCRKYVKLSQAISALMLISSLAQAMFAIWELVLCSKVLCPSEPSTSCCTSCCHRCCPTTRPTQEQAFTFVNAVSPQHGQLMQVTNPGAEPLNFTPAYQAVPPDGQVPQEQNQTNERNITPPPAYNVIP